MRKIWNTDRTKGLREPGRGCCGVADGWGARVSFNKLCRSSGPKRDNSSQLSQIFARAASPHTGPAALS